MATPQPAKGVLQPSAPYTPGSAPVKPEFVIRPTGRPGNSESAPEKREEVDDDAAEQATSGATGESDPKRPKLKGAARRRAKKEERAAQIAAEKAEKAAAGGEKSGQRGQNKNRKFGKLTDETAGLCDSVVKGGADAGASCRWGAQCKYAHDVGKYLSTKKRDLLFPAPPQFIQGPYTQAQSERRNARQIKLEELGLLRPLGVSSEDGLSAEAQAYLESVYTTSAPFVRWTAQEELDAALTESEKPRDFKQSILYDGPKTHCPMFHEVGQKCSAGWRCRFLGGHVKIHSGEDSEATSSSHRVGDVGLLGGGFFDYSEANTSESSTSTYRLGEYNWLAGDTMRMLRKKEFPLPRTAAALAKLKAEDPSAVQRPFAISPEEVEKQRVLQEEAIAEKIKSKQQNHRGKQKGQKRKSAEDGDEDMDAMINASEPADAMEEDMDEMMNNGLVKDTSSIDTARIRPSEKRRLNWRGELYLAPLTTTGNLPFRKLCSTFGSDIHCGEMGFAESYLQGNASEWSLVRRWEGERIFGTQLCGSRPELLVPVAEALYKECGDGLDFVDLNCGCPIDLVYSKGAGSALMDHVGRLGKILRGMSAVLGEIPVTIKMRTGTSSKVNTAHKLFARVQTEFGVGAATIHGRSRQQRYKNLADWNYIRDCANALRTSVQEFNESARTADQEELVPIPIYGNGDVYSWEDYNFNLEHTGVDGEMLARGALIKPWLFTEIKEKRSWDISSRERLDMVRQYASYGLSHWGSDTTGINLTRRFLCEAMSFWHRYIPVGLLEYVPPKMNDRPPMFKGRDELETLLSSPNAADWVKISEMFLGKAPEDWNFIPKHKSNSYSDSSENQG